MPPTSSSELTAAARRRQVPCQECRETHLKCDRLEPKCRRCAQLGYNCTFPITIRLNSGDYSKAQQWLQVPTSLSFIDETVEIAAEYLLLDDESRPDDGHIGLVQPVSTMPTDVAIAKNAGESQAVIDKMDDIFEALINFHEEPDNASNLLAPEYNQLIVSNIGMDSIPSFNELQSPRKLSFNAGAGPLIPASPSGPSYPTMTETEAQFFRHYIQTLGVCLDGGDPLKNFEVVVPERALACSALLKAIFAIAARHLCQTGHQDPMLSTKYHQESIRELVPMLNAPNRNSEEDIFATCIILRMIEEMSGDNNDDYLRSLYKTIKVKDLRKVRGTLGAASFWVGVRQEIYSAVMSQTPVKADLELADRGFDPTDNFGWTNRAVVLLADILNFCFGNSLSPVEQWEQLYRRSQAWEEQRPATFEPYFSKEATGDDVFPEAWFYSSCHIIGTQNHTLGRLFLTRFDPNIPRVGPTRKCMIELADQTIMRLARHLCGVAACNRWAGPAMHAASMGIAMFGDIFHDRPTQDKMLEILRKTELIHGRPTRKIQYQLMSAWGWTLV